MIPSPAILAACFLAASSALTASEPARTSVEELVSRYAPGHETEFAFEEIETVDGRDAYELESVGGKIVLRGSGGVAKASAFRHYLKEFCRAHVSWNGDQLELPETLPHPASKVRVVSPVIHRLAYNYCTHGYTMPFWGRREWAREIDWLALHGINRALIIQGQAAVWQNTFERFGHARGEMRQWLCSPAHMPWQFMGNIEGILPPSQAIVDERAELGRFIVERCRSLGIEPVLQGFYGMVPSGFAEKHPGAAIVPQGSWVTGTRRPDMLDPSDPMFPDIARAFMEEQQKIYGGDILYYAADPFHEGGHLGGMKRGEVYQRIQDAILAFNPRATLVKQCWQTSNKEMFDAGDKERSLALDLWCDLRPFWKKANGYDGTPWVWCMLFNFGGNTALEADLPRLAGDFRETLADPGRGRLEGVALVPEGS
ncbi:MAG: alpha-N-acetylglucosaminidase N-terminal domain-containing protein, partial [Verrucomicrobiae bacterium]|nr:alpha-N-acetylglucosaminidase N-terminal domain-containing protein [Verrucomicrobiae bacterium]